MASNLMNYLKDGAQRHSVGNVTGWAPIKSVINGAIVKESGGIDNYRLCELFYEDGEAKIKYATATTKRVDMVLTVTPERVLDIYNEQFCDFYNAEGDKATSAYLTESFTFQTSAFKTPENAKAGNFAVWDSNEKLFVEKTSYDDNDEVVFRIREIESDERYSINGTTLVELVLVR